MFPTGLFCLATLLVKLEEQQGLNGVPDRACPAVLHL